MTDRTAEQQKTLDDFVDLDWKDIRERLDRAEWYDGGNGFLERSVYLGRTWNLIQGDTYDVEEAQEIRHAAECSDDFSLDPLWWELVEEKASELYISVACGEDDGGDILATECGPPLDECVVMQDTDNTAYYGGKAIAKVTDEGDEELERRVKAWMREHRTYPLVFRLSDHGNLTQVALELTARYRIMTVDIVVRADEPEGLVSDEISELLSADGTRNPDSVVQDWRYHLHRGPDSKRIVTSPDPLKEDDAFVALGENVEQALEGGTTARTQVETKNVSNPPQKGGT